MYCHVTLLGLYFSYQTHSTKLEAICGNFNADPTDDFTTRDGTILPYNPISRNAISSHRQAQMAIINLSWVVSGTPLPTNQSFVCNNPDIETICESIFHEPWITPCHAHIDPQQAIDDCSVDLCAENTENTKFNLIRIYMDQCNSATPNTIDCNWRVNSGLSVDPCSDDPNSHFEECVFDPCDDLPTCIDAVFVKRCISIATWAYLIRQKMFQFYLHFLM